MSGNKVRIVLLSSICVAFMITSCAGIGSDQIETEAILADSESGELPPELYTATIPAPNGSELSSTFPTPIAVQGTSTLIPTSMAQNTLEPIQHLLPGHSLTITTIHMVNATQGWAIAGGPDWLARIRPQILNRGSDPQGDHILTTRDGGVTWQDVTPPEPMSESPAIIKEAFGTFLDENTAWITYNRTDIPASGQVIVWRTEDGGKLWEPSSPLPLSEITARHRTKYMAVSNDGSHGWLFSSSGANLSNEYFALYGTNDRGSTWKLLSDPAIGGGEQGCYKTGMDFVGSNIGWLTIECPITGATFSKTEDGGETWSSQSIPAPEQDPDFYENANCRTRSPILFTEKEGALVVECAQPQADYVRYLYYTIDAGETWQSSPVPERKLVFLDRSHAWAFGENTQYWDVGQDIYFTEDSGETWAHVKFVNWRGQFSLVDQLYGWAVGRTLDANPSEAEIVLVYSSNGAETWIELNPVVGP